MKSDALRLRPNIVARTGRRISASRCQSCRRAILLDGMFAGASLSQGEQQVWRSCTRRRLTLRGANVGVGDGAELSLYGAARECHFHLYLPSLACRLMTAT